MRKPLLSAEQYSRIYSVLASLADHVGASDTARRLLQGVGGAALMKRHYGLPAHPVCGAGAVVVHGRRTYSRSVAWFEEQADGRILATAAAFHCWVECGGWVVDFHAPDYRLVNPETPVGKAIWLPSKMLQRPVGQACTPADQLTRQGRAMFAPDRRLTDNLLGADFQKSAIYAWVEAACNWHQPFPHAVPDTYDLHDCCTRPGPVRLQAHAVEELW